MFAVMARCWIVSGLGSCMEMVMLIIAVVDGVVVSGAAVVLLVLVLVVW